MALHNPAEDARRAKTSHNSDHNTGHTPQAQAGPPAPGLEALLAALQGGGEPQGNIADLPPVVPGAIPGAANISLQQMLAGLTPEMLQLLSPIGQDAAFQQQQNQRI